MYQDMTEIKIQKLRYQPQYNRPLCRTEWGPKGTHGEHILKAGCLANQSSLLKWHLLQWENLRQQTLTSIACELSCWSLRFLFRNWFCKGHKNAHFSVTTIIESVDEWEMTFWSSSFLHFPYQLANRDLKIRGRRQWKRCWKSEFAFF